MTKDSDQDVTHRACPRCGAMVDLALEGCPKCGALIAFNASTKEIIAAMLKNEISDPNAID